MSADFAAAARRAVGAASALLGWRPHEVWAATPAELACALRGFGGAAPALAGVDLDRLKEQFPDG